MSTQTVLYDTVGPRAKRRNMILTVLFVAVIVGVIAWVIYLLDQAHELAPSKWRPFADTGVWGNILLPALWATVKAAGLSLLLALPVGAVLGIGRLSEHAFIRWPCSVIVEFFRAIPVLLLMVFATVAYQALDIGTPDTRPLYAVVTGLVLYNGSVLAEVLRAGVLSLPKGQTEASMAIGLRKTQMLWIILLPQALTAMLPAVLSQLVVIVKDTALGGQLLIAYPELLRSGRVITANYGNTVATYIIIATIFIALNFVLTGFAHAAERWLRRRRTGGGDQGEHMMEMIESGVVPGGVAATTHLGETFGGPTSGGK